MGLTLGLARGVVRMALSDALVTEGRQADLERRWEPGDVAGRRLQVKGTIDLDELEATAAAQIVTVLAARLGLEIEEGFDDL